MYPGKVTRIHGDGSIDVKYEDGDSDRNLKPSHVKALDSGSDRSRSRSRSPSRGRMRVGTRVEARYRYDPAFTLHFPPFTGRFVGAGARSIRARSRGSMRTGRLTFHVAHQCLLRRLRYDACLQHAVLRWFDFTQMTTVNPRRASKRASSRRSAAAAATPTGRRRTSCGKVTPSRRDIAAGRSIIRARSTETGVMVRTTLPTTMGNERRGSRPG